MGIRDFLCLGYGGKWVRLVFFLFGGSWGTPCAPAPPESMVARRVRPPGRNGWKGDESRGDRDLELGKWTRGGLGSHFAGAISPKAAASGPVYDKPTYEEVAEH